MSVNKVILIGHVGKDPEIRYLPDGGGIASFPLATTDRWTDKQGNKKEATEWHNVSVFGALAKVVSDYVSKGTQLYIEGAIKTDKWKDKEGVDRYSTKINVGMTGKMVLLQKVTSVEQVAANKPQSKTHASYDAPLDDIPF